MKKTALALSLVLLMVMVGTVLAMDIQNEGFENPPGAWNGRYMSFTPQYGQCDPWVNHVAVVFKNGYIYQVQDADPGELARFGVVACGGSGAIRVKYKNSAGTILAQHTKYFSGEGVRYLYWHNAPAGTDSVQFAVHNWSSTPLVLRAAFEGKVPPPFPGG